jgi:hypothetical protein
MLDEPYRHGKIFDAREHPPGTVFWMDYEIYAATLPLQPEAAPDAGSPATLNPLEAIGTAQSIAWPDGATYISCASWGVTARAKKNQALLYEVTLPAIHITPGGMVAAEPSRIVSWLPQRIVGEVEHEIGPGLEVMGRLLRIYRCASGEPGQRRRHAHLADALGQLVPGSLRPAHHTS